MSKAKLDVKRFDEEVRSRLRRARSSRGWSLARVQAESGGVWNQMTVGAWERGDRVVTIAKLARLCEFYEVSLPDILAAAWEEATEKVPDGASEAKGRAA